MDYNFNDFRDDKNYFIEDKTYIDRRNARRAAEKARQRRKKLIARRVTIVAVMVFALVLVVGLFWKLFDLFTPDKDKASTSESAAPTLNKLEVFFIANLPDDEKTNSVSQDALNFVKPAVPDDNKTEGHFSSMNSAVYIYNNAAYELFGGTAESAEFYAESISQFKAQVGDTITVYNMVIPKPIEYYVPDRVMQSSGISTNSQAENIKTIYSSYTEDVVPINCYNELAAHLEEYIYFRTDHHWTGLGAYYAYKAFCEQTGQKVLNLSACEENTISGYQGTLVDMDASLYDNLDTVHYWEFPYDTYATITPRSGDIPYDTSIYYGAATAGTLTYGVFIWGDSATFVEHSSAVDNGKKIAVIKDSYGNAFVPYLTANYEEVHVIDFRFFDSDLKTYCEENGITEVLFINNIMAANTAFLVDDIVDMFE